MALFLDLLKAGIAVAAFYGIFFSFRKYFTAPYLALRDSLKRHCTPISWIIYLLIFSAGIAVIYLNRYSWIFNAGDAAELIQTMYSASYAPHLTQTVYYFGTGYYKVAPLYWYGSVLVMNLCVTPLFFFAPFFKLMPHTPMLTIMLYFWIYIFGGASLYFIARKITNNPLISAYLLVLFILFPPLQRMVIYKGSYDVFSLTLLLWACYALYRNKALPFFIIMLFTAGVSMVTQYTCIAMALAAFAIHRERKYTFMAVFFIAINLFSMYAFSLIRFCMLPDQLSPITGMINRLITRNYADPLSFPANLSIELINVLIFIILLNPLMVVFAARDRFTRLLAISIVPAVLLTAMRGAAFTSHHNADIIAILLFACILLYREAVWRYIKPGTFYKMAIAQLLLFAIIPIVTFSHSAAMGRLANSLFETGQPGSVAWKDQKLEEAVNYLEKNVSRDASLCFRVYEGYEARLAARPSIWRMQTVPENHIDYPDCQYYFIEKGQKTYWGAEPNERTLAIINSPEQTGHQTIYENEVYRIDRNPHAPAIPFPQWISGFNVLKNIGKKECPAPLPTILPKNY